MIGTMPGRFQICTKPASNREDSEKPTVANCAPDPLAAAGISAAAAAAGSSDVAVVFGLSIA